LQAILKMQTFFSISKRFTR